MAVKVPVGFPPSVKIVTWHDWPVEHDVYTVEPPEIVIAARKS